LGQLFKYRLSTDWASNLLLVLFFFASSRVCLTQVAHCSASSAAFSYYCYAFRPCSRASSYILSVSTLFCRTYVLTLTKFRASAMSYFRLASKASGSTATSGVIGLVRISFLLDMFSVLAWYVHEHLSCHPPLKVQGLASELIHPTGTNPWRSI
jgi:hypothetical protein